MSSQNTKLIHRNIASIPQQITVKYQETKTTVRLTYTASAVVPSADATYSDITGSQINSKAVAHLKALPKSLDNRWR